MRKVCLTAGFVIVTLAAGGCGTRGQGAVDTTVPIAPPVQNSTTTSTAVSDDPQAPEAVDPIADSVPTSTTTTTSAPRAEPGGEADQVDGGEIEELLADLDSQLAGLDQLFNETAAAMAAEEEEILP